MNQCQLPRENSRDTNSEAKDERKEGGEETLTKEAGRGEEDVCLVLRDNSTHARYRMQWLLLNNGLSLQEPPAQSRFEDEDEMNRIEHFCHHPPTDTIAGLKQQSFWPENGAGVCTCQKSTDRLCSVWEHDNNWSETPSVSNDTTTHSSQCKHLLCKVLGIRELGVRSERSERPAYHQNG